METTTPGTQLTLGEGIRRARKHARGGKGYSQDELAAILGVSRPTYGNWERDTHCPDVQEFARLVDATQAPWLWALIDPRLASHLSPNVAIAA